MDAANWQRCSLVSLAIIGDRGFNKEPLKSKLFETSLGKQKKWTDLAGGRRPGALPGRRFRRPLGRGRPLVGYALAGRPPHRNAPLRLEGTRGRSPPGESRT